MAMAMTMSPGAGAAEPDEAYRQSIERWRSERVERLRKPDGWLSLVGMHWVDPGRHRIGSAGDNDIVLNTGPAQLGEIENDGTTLTFRADPAAGVSVDGQPAPAERALASDQSGAPTVVAFNAGEASFIVIERAGRLALRVRDAKAATRTGFTGIEYFPIDPSWRFEARYIAHPPGRTIEIASVINTIEPMPNPGALEFERDGKQHRLEVVDEGDGAMFVIFADRTNGKDTYGPGRFVYAEPLDGGRAVLDFNRAYNPPCAFNAFSTCPLPPPENRLDLRVEAGERKYTGPH